MQPEVITTIAVGVLLAMFTGILAWQGKGRFDVLEREVRAMKTELAEVRTEFKAEIKAETAPIRAELVSIHATLVQVALAVNPQARPEAG
jgi:hypothetical protein